MDNKISIIITCYNLEKYIQNCIDSVKNQTYKNLEIIIIDDGSKDKSVDIIKKNMCEDERIILITQENSGVSRARNVAMKKASGEYIMFIDGDDTIGLRYVEELNSCIKENSDLVIGGITFVYPNGEKNIVESSDFTCNIDEYRKKYFGKHTEKRLIFGPVNKLYRRSVIDEYNIKFDENIEIREDGMFVLDFIKNSRNICGTKIADYFYIQHISSVSLVSKFHVNEKNINHMFFDKLIDVWGCSDISDEYIESIYPMFLNMDVTSIRKMYNSKLYNFRNGIQYIKSIVRDEKYKQMRKALFRVNKKKCLKYYRPIILWHFINYISIKKIRK